MSLLNFLSRRVLTPAQIFQTAPETWATITAGVSVTAETAMRAATGKCIRLLADDISQLPLDFYRKVGDEALPMEPASWYLRPTTRYWDTWPAHISDVVVSLLSDGNDFLQGLPNAITPDFLNVLDPVKVVITEQDGIAKILYNGREFDETQVAHIPWVRLPGRIRGLSPFEAQKESTGLELAAREWAARFFGQGATLSGIIQTPPGATMTEEAKKNLVDSFRIKHQGVQNSHAVGLLTGGATFNPISVAPVNAALDSLWRQVLEEAAGLYHIPPHMLASQVSGGQAYASVEQKSIDYVQHAIVPIVHRLEATYSRFIPGDDTFVKFNVNALLRGDFKTQAESYSLYLQNKVIRREEVRARLDLPRDPAAAGYLETPNNNPKTLNVADPTAQTPAPATTPQETEA